MRDSVDLFFVVEVLGGGVGGLLEGLLDGLLGLVVGGVLGGRVLGEGFSGFCWVLWEIRQILIENTTFYILIQTQILHFFFILPITHKIILTLTTLTTTYITLYLPKTSETTTRYTPFNNTLNKL